MFNHITTIIFDLDGTIINSEPIHQKIEQAMMQDRGVILHDTEMHEFIGMAGYDMWRILKNRYQLSESVDELRADKRNRLEYFLNHLDPEILVPGVLNCLDTLYSKGFTLAIASSSGQWYVNAIIDGFDLRKYFKTVVTAWDVERSKPAPDIFLLALKNLQASPEECVIVEDSENGVKASIAVNVKVIGYQNADSVNQDLSQADYILENFSKFPYEFIQNQRIIEEK